jgi:expansin (peptidoglycan-binding protein)
MRSTILALLPLASIAIAESSCPAGRQTVTTTKYDTVTVTPNAIKEQATPDASTGCSRRTVTTTEVEKVTVTLSADEEPVKTIDVTSTSTLYLETTVTIHPTGAPSAAPSSMSLGRYLNTTMQVSSVATMQVSSAAAKPTSVLPDFSVIGQAVASSIANMASSVASSEAQAPSDAPATPKVDQDATMSIAAAGSKRGEATFYGGNTAGGMCSFTGYTIPSNLFGTALSDSNWDSANACGQCVSVTGPSGTQITAMVVDQCPGCGVNHLDLYPDGFKKLADPSKGIISISWDFVPCGITSPMVLKNKSGTSKFWFSMQVMNANVGVAKLEVSTDGGATWQATKRQPYNFFENPAGFGTDTVDVKVTSTNGKTVITKGVSIASNSLKTTGGNF